MTAVETLHEAGSVAETDCLRGGAEYVPVVRGAVCGSKSRVSDVGAIGRIFGWALIGVAILLASGEAVVALGTGAYDGIATADVFTLVSGMSPDLDNHAPWPWLGEIGNAMMSLPAWAVFGPFGFVILLMSQKKRRRMMPRSRKFVSS